MGTTVAATPAPMPIAVCAARDIHGAGAGAGAGLSDIIKSGWSRQVRGVDLWPHGRLRRQQHDCQHG